MIIYNKCDKLIEIFETIDPKILWVTHNSNFADIANFSSDEVTTSIFFYLSSPFKSPKLNFDIIIIYPSDIEENSLEKELQLVKFSEVLDRPVLLAYYNYPNETLVYYILDPTMIKIQANKSQSEELLTLTNIGTDPCEDYLPSIRESVLTFYKNFTINHKAHKLKKTRSMQ